MIVIYNDQMNVEYQDRGEKSGSRGSDIQAFFVNIYIYGRYFQLKPFLLYLLFILSIRPP